MTRWKRSGSAFSVNPDLPAFAIVNPVGLDLCNVVSHIIDESETKVFRIFFEYLLEALANPMHYCLTVSESVVDRASHGLIIIFSFVAFSWCACKFSVGQGYFVFLDGSFHDAQVI